MKKISLIVLAFALGSCAPAFVTFMGNTESALNLPVEVDRGDRFADPNLVENEKATGIAPSPDENLAIDSAQNNSGTPEELLARLNQRILNNTEYVFKNEGHKRGIGNACNFFLQRILERSGFSDDGYMAHEFDRYAKKHFTGVKTAEFRVEPLRKDAKNLEKFLFSFPEGTPFILQWKPVAGHGHLAIVTRKDGKLTVYEATLGKPRATQKETTARTLLSATDRYKMIVYVNFMPSDK